MPHKVWVAGEEVLSADFNAYVQEQVISTHATAAARSAAITAPREGQVTWLNDTNRLEVYDGVNWILFNLPPYTMSFGLEPLTGTFQNAGEATFLTPTFNYKMLVELGWTAFAATGLVAMHCHDMAGVLISPPDWWTNTAAGGSTFGTAFQFLTATRNAGTAASLRVRVAANGSGAGVRAGLAKVTIIQV